MIWYGYTVYTNIFSVFIIFRLLQNKLTNHCVPEIKIKSAYGAVA